MSALRRLEQLTAEASQQPMQEVIVEAVDLVVSIERTGKGRGAVRWSTAKDTAATRPKIMPKSMRTAMSHRISILLTGATLVAISVGFNEFGFASSGGGGLPWESPLRQIQQTITGPVAGFIALAAAAILIFAGELNDFCYVALFGLAIWLVVVAALRMRAAFHFCHSCTAVKLPDCLDFHCEQRLDQYQRQESGTAARRSPNGMTSAPS